MVFIKKVPNIRKKLPFGRKWQLKIKLNGIYHLHQQYSKENNTHQDIHIYERYNKGSNFNNGKLQ